MKFSSPAQELRKKIAQGLDSLQRGEGIDGDGFFAGLEQEELLISRPLHEARCMKRFLLSPEAARDVREIWS